MHYRPLGRTGEQVSVLGFGAMRLPVLDGRRERINIPLATEMLYYAIDHGVNYVDTAYPYHAPSFDTPGASEAFLGEALKGGYREKVLIATKLPVWLIETRADMDRILAGQLERLRVEHIDCYLLHGLNEKIWPKMLDLKVLDFLEAAKADGRIKHAGFSFHDEYPVFVSIVDSYDWDFCQIQYNYMDTEVQAGTAGLDYAASEGLGIIVMEPVKGGRLACAPTPVQAVWDSSPVRRTPVEWALRFVWDDARVSTVLSGMSTMDQVVANIRSADGANAGSLTREELRLISEVREVYRARTVIDCTGCRYCQPCPQNVNIPYIFDAVNNVALFDDPTGERIGYMIEQEAGHTAPATACEDCGRCEDMCPQHLEIREELKKAHALLGGPGEGRK